MKTYNENTVRFLHGAWGKGNKVIKNYGGNFWGPTRKRCSIFPPEQLAELQQDGVIQMLPLGNSFIVVPKGRGT